MEKNIKISVIMPVYNTQSFLKKCLNSIVNQTMKEIEIICINDGSTDGSLEILEDFARCDNRIQILSQENKGQSAARNRGLDIAQGEYIYFMDSDDSLALDALEFLYHEAECNKLEILYFDATVLYESEEIAKLQPQYTTTYTYDRSEELADIYTGSEILAEFRRIKSYRVAVWIQLFSRKFIQDNHFRFFEGIIYEDQLFTFVTMLSAKRTSHRKKQLFERCIRENSTMTEKMTMKHIRGYVVAYQEMKKFYESFDKDGINTSEIEAVLKNMEANIVKNAKKVMTSREIIRDVSIEEEEHVLVEQLLCKKIASLDDVVVRRDEKLKESRMRIEEKNIKLANRKEEIDRQKELVKQQRELVSQNNKEISELKEKIGRKEREYNNLKLDRENLLNSYSYKMGRGITYIPRKIRELFRK